ncbi:MAG TPA: hypothetical protein PK466_13735 [Thermotogota bacterium]|nr:hypothetical protein [Thermotogota bacterium]HPJ89147.1 hypothetical protein [Thermotogota bacterium]HPR97387.1 hypothetical protein [Thermotogota bacterium]
MKKSLFFSVVVLLVAMVFVSCTNFVTPEDVLYFLITNYNAGPGVEGAAVKVYEHGTDNLIGSAVSIANGIVEVGIKDVPERIDVKVTKQGHARSLVDGLKTADAHEFFSIILKTAQLNPDPATEVDPTVILTFSTAIVSSERAPMDITEPITGPFNVTVDVNAQNHVSGIYEPLLGRIAGAGLVTSDRQYYGDVDTADFTVSPTGHDGEVALYTTVYDHNDNRVLKVEYLNIAATDPGEVNMYQPMTMADFSDWMFMGTYNIENIWTYTRRRGIALNSTSRGTEEFELTSEPIASKIFKDHPVPTEMTSRVAPADANIWSQLYWADWSTMNLYYGYYPTELPNPGDEPDGYNLYRSLDGITYEKFGFITENFVADLADTISFYISYGYNPNQIMDVFPFYLDPSAFLHPGVEMYYQITSVYGTLESTPTDLGSVVPLDTFNVELQTPVNEAVDTSLNPNFRWRATNALSSSEGTPIYNYQLFIYDWVQADNGAIVPVDADDDFITFTSDSAGPIIAGFTGSGTNTTWDCTWKWYNPYGTGVDPYTATSLEPNKTYDWGLNVAYAVVDTTDSKAWSVSSDYRYRDKGWYIDPAGCMEPDLHADFTTGAQ